MTMFADISLEWDGQTLTIPAGNMLRAIAIVESIVTADELYRMRKAQAFERMRIATAYAAVLRFAGAKAPAAPLVGADPFVERVYAGMYDAKTSASVLTSLDALIALMVPQSLLDQLEGGGKATQGKPPRQARRRAASLSRARSK